MYCLHYEHLSYKTLVNSKILSGIFNLEYLTRALVFDKSKGLLLRAGKKKPRLNR